mgnify:CR=1 FL=1
MQRSYWNSNRSRLLVVLFLAVLPAVLTSAPAEPTSGGDGWTFASMPDFLNTDVADVRSAPGWTPAESDRWVGDGNATHEAFEDSIDYMLDRVASEQPEFVLAAALGDGGETQAT